MASVQMAILIRVQIYQAFSSFRLLFEMLIGAKENIKIVQLSASGVLDGISWAVLLFDLVMRLQGMFQIIVVRLV